MEINFDMDQFEESLKQQADQFSMIPSERVWRGIYNSLHPGSRWPSFTMIVIFVLAIVGIGPLNHFSKNKFVANVADNAPEVAAEETEQLYSVTNTKKSDRKEEGYQNSVARIIPIESGRKSTQSAPAPQAAPVQLAAELPMEDATSLATPDDQEITEEVESEAIIIPLTDIKPEELTLIIERIKGPGSFEIVNDKRLIQKLNAESSTILLTDAPRIDEKMGNSVLRYKMVSDSSTSNTPETVNAGIKKPLHKSKTTWIFFATPAISTTYFTGKITEDQPLINASPLMINPNQIRPSMRFNARIGLSVGGEMNHEIVENWEIVSGAQITYSGYNILAHKVHPTFSYLYLKDGEGEMVPKKYITFYGSGEGQDETVLHNNSLQLSLPVGLKYTVWRNNQIEVKVGTAVQPAAVIKGQAYILSADGKNYVMDPDLMKDINLSGELNSSISFQGEKMKWHIGPTIRFQALSSYKKVYPVNEHLVDYGIKIGISK